MQNKMGDELKKERENRGLSRNDLAKLLGVSRQTIWNWENRSIPKLINIYNLADIYQLPVEYFINMEMEYVNNIKLEDPYV